MFDYISLFTGIGGFDLACDAAGMNCVGHAENDKSASVVLKRHWPNVTNYGDVRNVKKENIQRERTIDLICGGFPCQDLSVAGERAGLAGERSGLWYEFARIIDEFEPRWVVAENVPGLLSSDGGRDFAIILSWLVKRGYGVCWRVLDAQYFGLAQRRKRVFIVASFGNGRCAEVLFERESLLGDPAQGRKTGERVARTIRGQSQSSHREDSETFVADVAPTLDSGYYKKRYSNQQFFSQNGDGFPITSFSSKDYGNGAAQDISPSIQSQHTRIGIAWHNHQQDGSVRVQEDDKSPTVSKHWRTGGNNVPFVGVRRLTPTECERLQGFPDGWTDGQADSPRYRQLGNAVAVPVLTWIMKRIMQADQLP